MMSLRRIFGLMLLFLLFEAIVAVATVVLFSKEDVLKACLMMTGLAVLAWVVFTLLSRSLSRARPAKETVKAFVPAPQKPLADDGFTLELTGLVEEANRRLAALPANKAGKVSPTVQSLPLYLVTGPEGSGKTTAIVNSGLEPKLLAGLALKDGQVVPTAAANVWYVDGTIFFEIGGRIFQQEPDRWGKTLQVLAPQQTLRWWERLMGRTTAPSNLRGVVLACDLGMFRQTRDPRLIGTTARMVEERLQAVQRAMREDFPVYVLMTRCDGVRYFEEFFSQLGEAESRRAVGMTLPATAAGNELANTYADRESGRLTKLFNRLYQSLADKRLLLLTREVVTETRAEAYEFPREFKKLRGDLVQFLVDSFRPSTLSSPCRLRGVYFTGRKYVAQDQHAISDGTLLDYSMAKRNDATAFFHGDGNSSGLDSSVPAYTMAGSRAARQIFLVDLFRKIVLEDPAAKVIAPPRASAEDVRYLHAALAACGVVLLLLSGLWLFSWQKNHGLLTEVKAAVRSTPVDEAVHSPAEQFQQMESVRPTMVVLHEYRREGAPLGYRWGMYAGDAAVSDLDSLYYTRFRQAVLDPMMGGMNQSLLALRADKPVSGDVYKDLKVYRMVTSGKCKPDEALVVSEIVKSQGGSASNADLEASIERQAQFYASELKYGDPYVGSIPENTEAVESAQTYLRNLSGPDKILQALLTQAHDKPAERLSGYAANYNQVLTGPDQMDGPFTSAGWTLVRENIREHKAMPSGEPCVVGEGGAKMASSESSEMDDKVRKLYSDSYAQAWRQYLGSHHVVPFSNTTDAAQKLRTLADNNRSPLLALVYMTSVNTNVAPMRDLSDEAKDKVVNVANNAASAIATVGTKFGLNRTGNAPLVNMQSASPVSVMTAFDPVHTMVDPRSPNKWLNEKNQPYMKALSDLGDALQTLPPQVHNDVPLETQELQTAKTSLLAADSALHSLAANFPNTSSGVDVDLQNLLREPIDQARRMLTSVTVVKTPTAGAGPAPVVPPVDPTVPLKIKATIHAVNVSAVSLCSEISSLQRKFPFDGTSTTDVSMEELNGLLQPGTGMYSQFANSPDVSRTYTHTGRMWAGKPEFPANYSQAFVNTLNSLGEMEEQLYGQGSATPHLDLTLTVDGTGKLPFEVEADGHVIKFTPGKPSPPVRLVWPPLTSAPTKLVLKASKKGGELPAQYPGPWGLFHLLQAADDQSGNVYTFRSVHFANSLMPLTNDKGGPATVQLRVDSAASNLFGRGYFARLRCSDTWALQSSETK